MTAMSSEETKVVTLRISSVEHARLQSEATAKRMSMNEYARWRLFETPPQSGGAYEALAAELRSTNSRVASIDSRVSTLDAAINKGRNAIKKGG